MSAFKIPLILIALYGGGFLLCSVLCVILFQTDPLHDALTVYFYRGLSYILIASSLTAAALYALTKHLRRTVANLSWSHPFCVTVCTLCLWSGFFGVIPVSLDRSISVFTLGWMYNHPQPLTKEGMTDNFLKVYVTEYDMFARRIHEQLVSGNIEQIPGSSPAQYRLTAQGRHFIESSKALARLLSADPLYLSPREALLPSLRQSDPQPDSQPDGE